MKREKHYPDKTQCQRKKVRMVDVSQVDLSKIRFETSLKKYGNNTELEQIRLCQNILTPKGIFCSE